MRQAGEDLGIEVGVEVLIALQRDGSGERRNGILELHAEGAGFAALGHRHDQIGDGNRPWRADRGGVGQCRLRQMIHRLRCLVSGQSCCWQSWRLPFLAGGVDSLPPRMRLIVPARTCRSELHTDRPKIHRSLEHPSASAVIGGRRCELRAARLRTSRTWMELPPRRTDLYRFDRLGAGTTRPRAYAAFWIGAIGTTSPRHPERDGHEANCSRTHDSTLNSSAIGTPIRMSG